MEMLMIIVCVLIAGLLVVPWLLILLTPFIAFSGTLGIFLLTNLNIYRLRRNVLIVDDDEVSVAPVLLCFKKLKIPHQISIAKCATEAFARLQKQKFDLIILDQKLPDLSGDDLLNLIEENIELTFNPSVIFYTGDPSGVINGPEKKYRKFVVKEIWTKKLRYTALFEKMGSALVTSS